MGGPLKPQACVPFVVVLLVALGIGAAAEGPPESSGEAVRAGTDMAPTSSVGTVTSAFSWTSTLSGDFTFRLEFDFASLEICDVRMRAAGRTTTDPVFTFQSHDEPGRTWTALTQDYLFGTHVSGISIRSNQYPFTHWASDATHRFTASGSESWLFAGNNLLGWSNSVTNGKSVIFEISCTGDFTITRVEGGKSVLGFTPAYSVGGAGAHAPLVNVNAADFTIGTFSQPHVAFRFQSDVTFGAGTVMLSGPGSADGTWMVTGDGEARQDGPAGRYQASMVRAEAGGIGAVGVFAAMEDVASLDAAAAL